MTVPPTYRLYRDWRSDVGAVRVRHDGRVHDLEAKVRSLATRERDREPISRSASQQALEPTGTRRHNRAMPGTGERRIVSVLISDVVDSTVIAETLGPERSKFLFDEIVGLMAEQVRRFDGTVAQLTGDGVLALFGAPAAHGDDAERAVRAAQGIHVALDRYAARGGRGVRDRSCGTGGGQHGAGRRPRARRVSRRALQRARRHGQHRRPPAVARGRGGVAVGPATARELAGRFELEPLGELELKGISQPVAAFRLIGEHEPEAAPLTPFVARDAELASVVDALVRLEDGLGSIVAITGEAGAGKSRLVAEARARAGSDVRVLVGSASSYTTQSPFWPIRDADS